MKYKAFKKPSFLILSYNAERNIETAEDTSMQCSLGQSPDFFLNRAYQCEIERFNKLYSLSYLTKDFQPCTFIGFYKTMLLSKQITIIKDFKRSLNWLKSIFLRSASPHWTINIIKLSDTSVLSVKFTDMKRVDCLKADHQISRVNVIYQDFVTRENTYFFFTHLEVPYFFK